MIVSDMLWQALPPILRWTALGLGFQPQRPQTDPAWRARVYSTAAPRKGRTK